MSDEEQISPEEKLLKVIQEPDGQEEAPAPAVAVAAEAVEPAPVEAVAEPAPVAAPEPAPVEAVKEAQEPVEAEVAVEADKTADKEPEGKEKPKLKVKKKAVAAAPAEEKPKSEGMIGAGGPTVVGASKRSSGKFGLKGFNKCLVAAAVVLFCLTGLDVGVFAFKTQKSDYGLSALENPEGAIKDPVDVPPVADGSEDGLVELPKLLSIFRNRPIFRLPGVQKPIERGGKTTVAPPPSKNWMKTVKSFKIIGVSKLPDGTVEVIATHSEKGMMFLVPGKALVVDDTDLKIEETGENFAVVTDGKDKLRI